jgi:predicted type IV restriction endonuclease
MNEETIKNTIILPYFQALGFDKSQLEFETSFTIRLGIFTYKIEGAKDKTTGRLDILFKKNGENLFVVETKAEGHKITNDDKLQAISYA